MTGPVWVRGKAGIWAYAEDETRKRIRAAFFMGGQFSWVLGVCVRDEEPGEADSPRGMTDRKARARTGLAFLVSHP